MSTPPTFVIFRVTTTTITVLLLLLLGLGLAGHGPFDGLSPLTSHAIGWLRANTGLRL
jgi:hypothetical protein